MTIATPQAPVQPTPGPWPRVKRVIAAARGLLLRPATEVLFRLDGDQVAERLRHRG